MLSARVGEVEVAVVVVSQTTQLLAEAQVVLVEPIQRTGSSWTVFLRGQTYM